MRLAQYTTPDHHDPIFGVVVDDHVVSVAALQREANVDHAALASMAAFVTDPGSAGAALAPLVDSDAARAGGPLVFHERRPLGEVGFLPPLLPPAALLDFALTPRHLHTAAQTMIRHEFWWLKRLLARQVVAGRLRRAQQERALPYYMGNHHAVIGDGEATTWPTYTSYLDIEPELAVVTGPPEQPIAGYTILNDLSARDVQMPELEGVCLTRSKHFDRGNGLGPFLVTPDEVGDPLALDVEVRIADRHLWRGSTSEYRVRPSEVIAYLKSVFPPAPGTVLGLGTIPGCCGLDNDEWLRPGDDVEITFARLGTLHQRIPEPAGPLQPSRWGAREELKAWLGS